MNLFSITIPDSAAALLVTYGAGALIRVQSCPTVDGSFGDVMTIPIVSGVITYAVIDDAGLPTFYYAYRAEAADGDPAGAYCDPFQPMPVAGVYASLVSFKQFIRTDATDEDDLLGSALEAASRLIDAFCHTTFPRAERAVVASKWTPTGWTLAVPVRLADTAGPLTIASACRLQAARLAKRRDAPFGIAGSAEFGSELRLLSSLDPDVRILCAPFVEWTGQIK